jgi:hypothetical protein
MIKTRKSIVHISVLLTLACTMGLLFTSCNGPDGNGKDKVVIDIPADSSGLSRIDHFISEASIKTLETTFQRQRDSAGKTPGVFVPESEAFNKRALLSLLQAPGCVGLRIYHGVKTGKRNELRLVIVGVDGKGKDILIDKSSFSAAKVNADLGGLEAGQCPPCLTDDQQ